VLDKPRYSAQKGREVSVAKKQKNWRLNVIRMMLSNLDYAGKCYHDILPDPGIVFPFSKAGRKSGLLAP
jgi:hypothetical protein